MIENNKVAQLFCKNKIVNFFLSAFCPYLGNSRGFLQSWLWNEKMRVMLKTRLNKVLAHSRNSSIPWPFPVLWTVSLTLFWPGPTRVAGYRSPCSSALQVLDFLAFVIREAKSSFIFQVCYFRIYGTWIPSRYSCSGAEMGADKRCGQTAGMYLMGPFPIRI